MKSQSAQAACRAMHACRIPLVHSPGHSLAADRLLPLSRVASDGGANWIYLPGLQSVRRGEKSQCLERHAVERVCRAPRNIKYPIEVVQGEDCLILDQRGHGDSTGTLQEAARHGSCHG